MKEWFLSTELIHIEGMPNTTNAIARNAKRNNWLTRKAQGGGRSYEYHISNFHYDVQKYLYETLAEEEDKRYLGGPEFSVSIQQFFQAQADSWLRWEGHDREIEESNALAEVEFLGMYSDWCELPVFDVHAAAGAKSLINTEYQIDSLSLPRELIKNYGVDEKRSAIIFVDGSSMVPTLDDGDRVLVDLRETQHPVKDGVYVIRIDEAVYIKRLRWNIAKGVYNVISDNTDYEPFEINHNNGRSFNVIGKVKSVVMKEVI